MSVIKRIISTNYNTISLKVLKKPASMPIFGVASIFFRRRLYLFSPPFDFNFRKVRLFDALHDVVDGSVHTELAHVQTEVVVAGILPLAARIGLGVQLARIVVVDDHGPGIAL